MPIAPEPPQKKHKSTLAAAASASVEVSGATSSAAKGGAAEETSNRATQKEDPSISAANFIDALKDHASMTALKGALIDALKDHASMAALKGALKGEFVTKEEHEQTVARLNQIAEVFGPATKFALFETAIYEFVEPDIRKLQPRSNLPWYLSAQMSFANCWRRRSTAKRISLYLDCQPARKAGRYSGHALTQTLW